MKAYLRRILSMVLVIALFTSCCLTSFAESVGGGQDATGSSAFTYTGNATWAQAGKQVAGMLSLIAEDAADIDLSAYSARIRNLSLEDDSVYLAILAEKGYLPDEPAQIDPAAAITADEYILLMAAAFPTVVGSQAAIDSLQGEADPGNIAIMGDNLSMTTMLPERLAVVGGDNVSLTAVNAEGLSLNAAGSIDLSGCEITRVHIQDTVGATAAQQGTDHSLVYLHMDSSTQLPEVIVKSADEVVIEGSGALGVVRVQETVGALTVRATASIINETTAPIDVTGPDAQTVTLQPGEQVDFVLSKWLVSFVTEGTPVETQEIAPGGMVNYASAVTTLDGKVFTAWYEDADYTEPVSRLSTVNRQMTLYARFVSADEAVTVTFETFGGRQLSPMVFAKGEYLLTKPVESLYTSKDGYSFGGWCVDEDCTTAFGYTDPIDEDMTLYAMYSSYEQIVQEDPGTVAELELADGAQTIGLILPDGMTANEALNSITVEAGTGLEVPVIAVRDTGSGAELYCADGFTPGSTFTLYVQDGVQFAGYPEYIDTLSVSVYREQVEILKFAEDLIYVLWDNVTDYTPVSKTDVEYTTTIDDNGTVHDLSVDNDAEGNVIPGTLIMTGEVNFQPEQVVVFYDGEINRDEDTIESWEGGDLAGYVLFAEIQSTTARPDGTTEVTFRYADPEDYIAELDLHTTQEVNLEEQLTAEQIEQIEKAIAAQLAANDELKAQMLVAVMTSAETQQLLDDKYGEGTYSLAALVPVVSDPQLDVKLTVKDKTATAGIGVGITVSLYWPQGLLAEITPYLYFEQQLTLDVNMDGGFLWLDMSVLFRTKTTVSLQIKATTGDTMDDVFDEALDTLREIVQADGTAVEEYDYQEAADSLMNTMSELIDAELEYQDLFAVPLFKYKVTYYGIITFGINVELIAQAAVVATFGVTVTAEYGQKIGFCYNFLKFKGGSYKEKLASEVTTEVYLLGKMGVRVGISIIFSIKLLQNVTVSTIGSIYAYVELAGMFFYTYALSADGGNMAGALYLEVGIDAEIELALEVEIFIISRELNWTVWSDRWPLYSLTRGMTMSVVQTSELEEMWALSTTDADGKTSYPFRYLPMKTYDMLTAECTENQLLLENLQEGSVTAKLTLENIVINGEHVTADDPRTSVMYVGDGVNGKVGVVYADELAAASYQVTDYQCDVVLTYENSNRSELIKFYQKSFPLSREFRMATTTVNVNIALYDWCAHSWGIESAEWDNVSVFATTFENTHVLGCPVEPTATGEIDLDAVIAAVKAQYPELADMTLSWFTPTLNQVDRTVQYSVPLISKLCYITPESGTVRYDVFSTTTEYNLTFNLFVNRFPGYTGDVTYILEASEASADTVFTVTASNGETMTFQPVEGETGRWMLTVSRAAFNGTECPVMLKAGSNAAVSTGLVITGREADSEVILTLGDITRSLTVTAGEGIAGWDITSHTLEEMSAIIPGDRVFITAELEDGYSGVRLTSKPEGLKYYTDGNRISFNMPSYDVKVTLEGVRSCQVDFLYNYGSLGTYAIDYTNAGDTVLQPADPYVAGLTFAGWYDNAACEGEPFDFTQAVEEDVILYANWYVNVTVDFGGATGPAAYVTNRSSVDVDGDIMEVIESALIFPGDSSNYSSFTYATHKVGDTALEYVLPNYSGYDFMGWYLTPDFSGEAVKPETYVLTGGVTFYACWKQIAVLTYELNYGEQELPYAMSLEHVGEPLIYIPENPVRENYDFLGWFRLPNGGEVNRVTLDENYVVEGTMTLYACWAPTEYAIRYVLGDNGVNNAANPASHTIESGSLPLYAPTRASYNFLGWEVAGIDALDVDAEGNVSIPAGLAGDITLTALWEPVEYSIAYELIRGETAQSNPTAYTVESDDITLSNPVADGYEFTGWTGTGLDGKTITVTIPRGSSGDRQYTATWLPTDPTDRMVAEALEVIPDPYTVDLADFTGVADYVAAAEAALAADDYFSTYADHLTVTAVQEGDPTSTDTAMRYSLTVTITLLDDNGQVLASDSRNGVILEVLKKSVNITAAVDYTDAVDGIYIAYGTPLSNVKLTGTATDEEGNPVTGTFAWAEPDAVPLASNNDKAVYKVVFTPDEAFVSTCSTAETLVAVTTQIGVKVMAKARYTEYSAAPMPESAIWFYGANKETGEQVGTVVTITGGVLEQTSIEPGPCTVTLTDFESITITGVTGDSKYAVDTSDISTTFEITRASARILGQVEYSATVDTMLNSLPINLRASTLYQSNIAGTFSWDAGNVQLDTLGTFTYVITFTPDDLIHYAPYSRDITIHVLKKVVTAPGIETSITYDGKAHVPNISETDDYTVTGNEAHTDAGTYLVTLTLKNPEKCCWSDDATNASKTLTYTIKPADLTMQMGSNFQVTHLSYGQQLSGEATLSSNAARDGIYKVANDMIMNLNVLDINGNDVPGKWVWDDSAYVYRLLDASSASTTDTGISSTTGYEVHATYQLETEDPNYNALGYTFHVDVERVVPVVEQCTFAILEGAVYMPATEEQVNPLNDFTPIFTDSSVKPTNPNDPTMTVDGTLKWEGTEPDENGEESKRYFSASQTFASAVFTPTDTVNYLSPTVQVPVTFKSTLDVDLYGYPGYICTDASADAFTDYVSTTWTPTANIPVDSHAYIGEDLIGIATIRVYAYMNGGYQRVLDTSYRYNTDTHKHLGSMSIEFTGDVEVLGGWNANFTSPTTPAISYNLSMPGTIYDTWMRHDLRIEIYFGYVKTNLDSPESIIEQITSGSSSYSLRSRTLALAVDEALAEATLEPTPAPTPEVIERVVTIEPEQASGKADDVWQIQLEEGQKKVRFNWNARQDATEYLVYALRLDVEDDEKDEIEPELIARTTDQFIELRAADYAEGIYALYVGAVLADGSVTWSEAQFELLAYVAPTAEPTVEPTAEPTEEPTEEPTAEPTEEPTEEPTTEPTEAPTAEPTAEPTEAPTAEPTAEPTEAPTAEPTAEP
ncbi:MAG: InlB B-repeat-containing protein, partial [Aristaeellaceae bacterium]